MATKKRPIGLKAQKLQHQQHENDRKKPRIDDELDGSFTTVALVDSKDNEHGSDDGLTLADLIQLKNQADELIDNPSGLEADENQLLNLLRGLCHEAVRLIDLAEQQNEGRRTSTTRLLHQLLAWATLELGIFLQLHPDSQRLSQADEPNSIDRWLSISQTILDDHLNSSDLDREPPPEDLSDLKFLPHVISILKSQQSSEISSILTSSFKTISNQRESTYLLRTIDRLILLEPTGLCREPTPVFKILIECLKDIRDLPRPEDSKLEDHQTFHRLIDQRLGDCYLAHASILAEELENKYYDDQEVESSHGNPVDEEEFPIDTQDPIYSLALDHLTLAEETFSRLLKEIDEEDENQAGLKTKLNETLLTRGNLTAPGPEREKLYLCAGLSHDKDGEK